MLEVELQEHAAFGPYAYVPKSLATHLRICLTECGMALAVNHPRVDLPPTKGSEIFCFGPAENRAAVFEVLEICLDGSAVVTVR